MENTTKGADMAATETQTPKYEIGSREWTFQNFAGNLRRHADKVDEFANDVEAWGEDGNRSPRAALGLIERGNDLAQAATNFYTGGMMGQNTKSSFRNDAAIALGATNGVSSPGRGNIGYAIVYALSQTEKYGEGTPLADMKTKSSSLRVHAASCRVIAKIAEEVAAGKYHSIG